MARRSSTTPPTRATPKERAIQRAILDYLATVPGVVAWKTGGGMFPMTYKGKTRMVRMGKPGVSDIVGWRKYFIGNGYGDGVVSARFLAIEVKKPGRYPTVEQATFLKQVEDAGGIAIVARSVSDVAEKLGRIERSECEIAVKRLRQEVPL